MTSVAYLEATINEFFMLPEIDTYRQANYKNLTDETVSTLIEVGRKVKVSKGIRSWLLNRLKKIISDDTNYGEILLKYLEAYRVIKGGAMKKNEVFREVNCLIELRNELMHYKPQWQPTKSPDEPYTGKCLKDKFKENIFVKNTGDAFFPKKCLGAGCAAWSIDVSEEFIKHFYSEVGVPIPDFSEFGRINLSRSLEYCVIQKPSNMPE